MTDTEILLNDNTTYEEKYKAAHNIIINYELSLSTYQMLLAFKKVLEYLHNLNIFGFKRCKNSRLFLFNEVLNIDKNMYIALILALCDNLDPDDLWFFMIFDDGFINCETPIDVGIAPTLHPTFNEIALNKYYKLLDHYEFDINNIKNISEVNKNLIQAYRTEKYACKSTKLAIKK